MPYESIRRPDSASERANDPSGLLTETETQTVAGRTRPIRARGANKGDKKIRLISERASGPALVLVATGLELEMSLIWY